MMSKICIPVVDMFCLCNFSENLHIIYLLLLLLVVPSLLACVACTSVDQHDCLRPPRHCLQHYWLCSLADVPVWRQCVQNLSEQPKLDS